jgi:hypothetical protein
MVPFIPMSLALANWCVLVDASIGDGREMFDFASTAGS